MVLSIRELSYQKEKEVVVESTTTRCFIISWLFSPWLFLLPFLL